VDKNTKTVILEKTRKVCSSCGKFKMQQLFPKVYFAHTTTYAFLPLFMGSWNFQEYLDSSLFWAGDGQFCERFLPFCVFDRRNQLKTCVDFHCIFGDASFELIKNLANLVPEKIQGLTNPSYTTVTP